MFGIGYQEMFIVLVVALVIFGPSRLPELAGQVGRWVRDFRRMSADLTGEFEKTFAEVDEVKKSFKREMQSIQEEVEGVGKSARGELKKSAAKSTAAGKRTPAGALKSGGSTGAAGKARGTVAGSTAATSADSASKDGANGAAAVAGRPASGAAVGALATKAHPLVDVSYFDADADPLVAQNGSPKTNGATVPAVDDALSRVRRRRMTASYGHRGTA